MLIDRLAEIDEDPGWTYLIREGIYMPTNIHGEKKREAFCDLILLYDNPMMGAAIEYKSSTKHRKHAMKQIYNGEKFIREHGYYYKGGKFVTLDKSGFKYEKIRSYRHSTQIDCL